MPDSIAADYLADVRAEFRKLKTQGERALEQVRDQELTRTLDEESNSIETIVKHLAGNMRSRWTDFLTTDGEKPDRRRDEEFESSGPTTRATVLGEWEDGWRTVLTAVDSLTPDDLGREVTIRGEAHSVVRAINRQLTHYAGHVGQLVLLAKHFRGREWKTLSIPRKRA